MEGEYRYEPVPGEPPPPRKKGLDFEEIFRRGMAKRERELTYDYDPEEEPDYRPGTHVYHPRYGEGKILRREGEGERLKLTVSFSGYRPKKFLAKYAQLQTLQR